MVYCIHSKIQVKGSLEVTRSLHVGGFGTSTNVDLPLAVNGQGQVYIPGTSLAGALRGWMARVFDEAEVDALWGFQPDPKSQGPDLGHASRILIEDALVCQANGDPMMLQQMELRSGVGIDRHLGSAAEQCLYNRGVIPRGSTLSFEFSVEIPDAAREAVTKTAIDQLLLAMQEQEIRLGAAKSRGLGRVKLRKNCQQLSFGQNSPDKLGVQPVRLNSREGILALLQHHGQTSGSWQTWKAPDRSKALPRLIARLHWNPIGPLMVKSEMTGVVVDILPLMGSISNSESTFLLPGSAIKGAVRSQAERIVRTVLNRPLPRPSSEGKQQETNVSIAFKDQIRLPLIDILFGLAADDAAVNGKTKWAPGLGALFIEDCFSKTTHPAHTLQTLSQVPKDDAVKLKQALEDTKLTDTQQGKTFETQLAYHVAIDRWTGGAAENFLYTNLEPFHIPWEPIELAIDFGRFSSEGQAAPTEKLAAVALLLLLLRDLADRRIPLGYGTNRGLGTLTLTRVDFSIQGEVPSEVCPLTKQPWTPAATDQPLDFSGLDATVLEALNAAWQAWIQSEQQSEQAQQAIAPENHQEANHA